jgi:hypothetical protein
VRRDLSAARPALTPDGRDDENEITNGWIRRRLLHCEARLTFKETLRMLPGEIIHSLGTRKHAFSSPL